MLTYEMIVLCCAVATHDSILRILFGEGGCLNNKNGESWLDLAFMSSSFIQGVDYK